MHLAGTMAKCPLTEGLLYVVKKKHLKHSFDWVACKQAPSLFFSFGGRGEGGGWVGRLSGISYMRALRQIASGCLSFRARRGEWKSKIMQINDKREELPLSFLAGTLDLLCLKRKKNKRLPAQISRARNEPREDLGGEIFVGARAITARSLRRTNEGLLAGWCWIHNVFFQVVLLSLFLARYAVNIKLGRNTAG